MAEAALDFFNSADLPALPVATLGESLRAWLRLDAKRAAAQARLVNAFDAVGGDRADGQSSVGAWIAFFCATTTPAGKQMVATARKIRKHVFLERALSVGVISVSYATWIMDVLRLFPCDARAAVEEILVRAARDGATVEDLSTLASEAFRRVCPDGPQMDEDRIAAERGVSVSKTFGGVGRINGDLTAHATALAQTVIEGLAVKRGPEDSRTRRQRRHDALAEAFQLLVGSDLLPERGGSKPQVKVDLDLATLRRLDGATEAETAWIRQKALQLTLTRLAAEEGAGDPGDAAAAEPADGAAELVLLADVLTQAGLPPALGGIVRPGAILTGAGHVSDRLASALACDSLITPTVTGHLDRNALADLAGQWLAGRAIAGRPACTDPTGCLCDCHRQVSGEAFARVQETLLRSAIAALSGPGGLASYLRTEVLRESLAGPSIVLDVGADTRAVPIALERSVRRRDRRCRFPGCDHPAELSQVHHIVPRAQGGPTTLWNLISLCAFHHLTAIHTWGWRIRLNSDGSATATAPGPIRRELHESRTPRDGPASPAA